MLSATNASSLLYKACPKTICRAIKRSPMVRVSKVRSQNVLPHFRMECGAMTGPCKTMSEDLTLQCGGVASGRLATRSRGNQGQQQAIFEAMDALAYEADSRGRKVGPASRHKRLPFLFGCLETRSTRATSQLAKAKDSPESEAQHSDGLGGMIRVYDQCRACTRGRSVPDWTVWTDQPARKRAI
jgi:hypothetical protein